MMKKLTVTLFLAFLTACAWPVWAYDLPEIIGEFYTDHNVGTFVCIGDQNGDGCDDILVGNEDNPDNFYQYYQDIHSYQQQLVNTRTQRLDPVV